MPAFRESLRFLRQSPALAATAIGMLALGIAVNTISLSLLNNLAFRLIPAVDADRLVRVYPLDEQGRRGTLVSYPDYRELRERSSTLADLAAYVPTIVTVRVPVRSGAAPGELAEPHEMFAAAVSANYFSILGVQAARGRLFLAAEDRTPDTHAVAVISHRLWERLGASIDAMATPLVLNGRTFSIIGVLPETFVGTEPLAVDLWVPAAMQARVVPGRDLLTRADETWLILLGRLRPGATRAAAERELSPLLRRLAGPRPPAKRASGVTVRRATFFPIDRDPAGVAAVWMLATVLLLAAACANVTNLMLARAVTRRREIAIRLALGAGWSAIVRQSLAESAWLAALAGALALALSSWTLSVLYRLALPMLPFEWGAVVLDVDPDWTVFLATTALCGVAAALVGLAPALQARRVDVTDALRGSVSSAGRRLAPPRARALLVNAQVAISVALIIAAGLLAKAAERAEALDLGFSTDGVLLATYDLERHQYSGTRAAAFNRVLVERARQIPGVVSASLASHVALTGGVRLTRLWSAEAGGVDRGFVARYVFATGGYFGTLGIPLARGRDFPAGDRAAGPAEAVVSEMLARTLWPGRDPIGERIRTGLSDREYHVVGVVRDTRAGSLWRDKEAALYLLPLADEDLAHTRLIVKTRGDADLAMREIGRVARGLEPDASFAVRRLDDVVGLWILPSRAAAALSACIGVMALLIASFGAYGVMRHVLAQQTRALGIRHALGADAGRLVRVGLRQALPLVLPGVALGLLAGHLIGRVLSAALHGITGRDPVAYVAGTVIVCLAAFLACYLPARRVARVDPMAVLRAE